MKNPFELAGVEEKRTPEPKKGKGKKAGETKDKGVVISDGEKETTYGSFDDSDMLR